MLQQTSPFIPQTDLRSYNSWAQEVLDLICCASSELQINLYIGSILDKNPQWIHALLYDYPYIENYIEIEIED